jgi:hypothetical protein
MSTVSWRPRRTAIVVSVALAAIIGVVMLPMPASSFEDLQSNMRLDANAPFADGFPLGAPIAATLQARTDQQVDLFAVNNWGALNVSWIPRPFTPGGSLGHGPATISPLGVFPPGGHVAVAPQINDITTAFAVDKEGFLSFVWVVSGHPWQGPLRQGPAIFPPGAPVAMAKQGANQLDVFTVDKNGVLNVTWAVGGGAWQGPVGLTPGIFPPGAGVAMAQQTNNILTAFAVDREGFLNFVWAVGGGKWQGPLRQGPATFPPGAPIAMINQDNNLDVFAITNNGVLSKTEAQGTGKWVGPQFLNFEGPPAPALPQPPRTTVPIVKPSISVDYDAGKKSFTVKGQRFLASHAAHIRVVNNADVQNPVTFPAMSDGSGRINLPITFPINVPQVYSFSANDERPDRSDLTGTLWSNTVTLTAT